MTPQKEEKKTAKKRKSENVGEDEETTHTPGEWSSRKEKKNKILKDILESIQVLRSNQDEMKQGLDGMKQELDNFKGEMKQELDNFKGEMKQELDNFKGEMKQELDNFKGEMKQELDNFKGEMKQELDNFKGEMKQEMDTFEGEMKQELKHIKKEVKSIKKEVKSIKKEVAEIKHTVNALLLTNPLACLRLTKPSILTSEERIQRAVHEGGTATWTIMKTLQGRFYAIGSKHCAFYYGYVSGPYFVSLPKRVAEAGVLRVGTFGGEKSVKLEHDAVVVEISCCPKGMNPEDLTLYQVPANRTGTKEFVVGMSESGPVIGKTLVKDKLHGYYVFVEDQGEPGNSGTIMFTPDLENPGKLQMFGTYYGLVDSSEGKLRSRGVVAPLPSSLDDFDFDSNISVAQSVDLIVLDKRGYHEVTATRALGQTSGIMYHKMQDDGEWPGVVLNKGYYYQGCLFSGSTRSG